MGVAEQKKRPVILQTKITPPSLPADIIFRSHLLRRLNDLAELPVVLVSSPAGYGKSCLASLWFGRVRRPCAWVSLDKEDCSYDRFWTYCTTALIAIGLDAENLLNQTPIIVDTDAALNFVDRIIEKISTHNGHLILILEDYHNLEKDSPVHASVAYLVSHLPKNLHLVITSRTFPRIGLQKLRVQSLLGEIGEKDLCFSLVEVEDLFFRSHQPLTAEESRFIHEYTKGWPVAVKLASLAYAKNPGISQTVPPFEVGEMIYDYLFEEVIDKLPDTIRTFLAVTACVDGFSVSLAQHLIGEDLSEISAALAYLKENSLFIGEATAEDGSFWYRYHSLFLEAIRHRFVAKDGVLFSEVQRKASAWYEDHKLFDAAVKTAAQAKDFERIQKLIYQNWNSFYHSDHLAVLMRWYSYLPESYVAEYPMLCAIESLPLATSGKVELALSRIRAAERAMKNRHDVYYGLVMAIKGITFSVLELTEEASSAAQEALKYLPEGEEYLQGMSYQILGGVKSISAPEVAAQIFEKALEMPLTRSSDSLLCSARANLSVVYSILGNFSAALEWADATMSPYESSAHPHRPMLVYAYESKAFACYKLGRLGESRKAVDYAIQHAYDCWNPLNTARAYAVRAHLAYFASEDEAAAEDVRQSLQISPYGFARTYPALPALQFWQEKGVIEKSSLTDSHIEKNREPFVWTKTALDFVRGLSVDIEAFEVQMQHIPEERVLAHIQFRVLLAALYEAKGDTAQAEEVLSAAVESSRGLAAPKQVFIENTPFIAKILGRIAKRSGDSYSTYLFRALPAVELSRRSEEASPSSLTAREKEVICLVIAGLSTKEIAERLFVSTATAKKHLANIYIKLGVHGRVQAISKLRDEGILAS